MHQRFDTLQPLPWISGFCRPYLHPPWSWQSQPGRHRRPCLHRSGSCAITARQVIFAFYLGPLHSARQVSIFISVLGPGTCSQAGIESIFTAINSDLMSGVFTASFHKKEQKKGELLDGRRKREIQWIRSGLCIIKVEGLGFMI